MPNFETSFIPEQGTTYQSGSRRSTVATVFAIIITIIAGGLSGAAWWFEQQELKKVKGLEADLSSMESRFDIAKISQLGLLDKKIDVAKNMLSKHPLPSMIIDYLADNTVASIKWKQITYTRASSSVKPGDTSGVTGDTIDLQGETVGYSPLYQQLNYFRTKSTEITSVDLKNFTIDPRTNILSIQMRITMNPNYATVATARAKSSSDNIQNNIIDEVPTPTAPAVNPNINLPVTPVAPQVIKPTTTTAVPQVKQTPLSVGSTSKPVQATTSTIQ